MSRLESLKHVLNPDPNRAQGDDLKDTQVERDVYRYIKKTNAIAKLPADDPLKKPMEEINAEQKKYFVEAFKLLKANKDIALMMSQKSDDKIEQAWILARMLKEQYELEMAKAAISGNITSIKDYYKKA